MTLMKSVEYIVGTAQVDRTPLSPYSKEAIEFTSDLSRTLLAIPECRQYPDIIALAFWCRRANILGLKERCVEAAQRLGRGLCFHIAPGNIPINFAFSYLFGVLSGCANIVRLPSRVFPQTQVVCRGVSDTLSRHDEIAKRTAFVRYPADDEISTAFCEQADVRLIWGGDRTIASVKHYSSKPRCIDIAFADRYSFGLFNGEAVLKADDKTVRSLAENFYNDTYLMDQNACSSPQMIFWMNDSQQARERFWNAVYETAQRKYVLQPAVSVEKYTKMCEDAVHSESVMRCEKKDNLLYRMQVETLPQDVTCLRGKGGYFYEHGLDGLEELVPYITEKYQTITYFGFDGEALRDFVVTNHLRGIDRIVQVGKAMDIGMFWDGYDLARVLSRVVRLE